MIMLMAVTIVMEKAINKMVIPSKF